MKGLNVCLLAVGIWVFIKLPQEWWIHIAKLDLTEQLAQHPALGLIIGGGVAVIGAVLWRRRPDRPSRWWRRVAADPVPEPVRAWQDRSAFVAAHGRVLSMGTAQKVALVGLISVVYAQVLPGVRSTNMQLFAGLAAFVVLNAAISLALARGGFGTDNVLLAFALRLVLNSALVVLADRLLGSGGGRLYFAGALFLIAMLSLLTLLDDRFRPVADYRGQQAVDSEEVRQS